MVFAYLVAIIDWHSRFFLSWRLSNSMGTSFCLEALDEAPERYGAPEIFNSDQGAQLTAKDFTPTPPCWSQNQHGRQRPIIDHISVERLWRSLKYEEVFLHAYEDMREARDGISRDLRLLQPNPPAPDLGLPND